MARRIYVSGTELAVQATGVAADDLPVVLVDCQFRIYRASAASPLGEGERIKVRGCHQRAATGTKSALTLPLSLGKGEVTRTA